MVNGLLGKKIGMSQVFDSNGEMYPVTVIETGPCYVTQIKSDETDGYSAVQIGFLDKKLKQSNKAEQGHVKKADVSPKKVLKEIFSDSYDDIKIGQELTVDIFKDVKVVDVTGTTKGKGFAGVIKRWGFSGGPGAHGSTCHRRPGSIGAGTNPGRVIKGKKMSGRMGNRKKSIKNLDVVKVDTAKNLLLVKGAVPGTVGSYVLVKKSKSIRP